MHNVKKSAIPVLLIIAIIALIALIFSMGSFRLLSSPSQGAYNYGKYGEGAYSGDINGSVSDGNYSNDTFSQDINEIILPVLEKITEISEELEDLKRVLVLEESKIIRIKANETILLGIPGKNESYVVRFDIINGKVVMSVLNGDFILEKAKIIDVLLDDKLGFVGLKKQGDDESEIVIGLDKNKVEKEISPNAIRIYSISVVILTLGVIIVSLVIVYLVRQKRIRFIKERRLHNL